MKAQINLRTDWNFSDKDKGRNVLFWVTANRQYHVGTVDKIDGEFVIVTGEIIVLHEEDLSIMVGWNFDDVAWSYVVDSE